MVSIPFAYPPSEAAVPQESNMAIVLTDMVTPRKIKVAMLVLVLFAAMC